MKAADPQRAVQAYLRRATLGLSAAVAQEVRDELEEHLLCRAHQLEHGGLSPEAALAQALREVGPPLLVSAGMNRVHHTPRVLLGGALLLGAAALLAVWASSSPLPPLLTAPPGQSFCVHAAGGSPLAGTEWDLPVVSRTEERTCYRTPQSGPAARTLAGLYLPAPQVAEQLQAQGAQVTPQSVGLYGVNFPNGNTLMLRAPFEVDGVFYLSLPDLIDRAVLSPGPLPDIRLSGFEPPHVTLEGLSLRFAGRDHGAEFYRRARFGLTAAALYPGGLLSTDETVSFRPADTAAEVFTHRLGGLPPGDVVLLITRQGESVYSDIRPVGADGRAELLSAAPRLRFVDNAAALIGESEAGEQPALLVRLNDVPLPELGRAALAPQPPQSVAGP